MKSFSLKKVLVFTIVAIMVTIPLGVVFGDMHNPYFTGASVTTDGEVTIDGVLPEDGLSGTLSLAGLADDDYITELSVNVTGAGINVTGGAINIGNVTNDDDGEINVSDAIAVLRHIVGLDPLEGYALAAADVKGDGNIAVGDAIDILRYIVGLKADFDVQYVLMVTAIGDLELSEFNFNLWYNLAKENVVDVAELLGDDDTGEPGVSIGYLKTLLIDGDTVEGTLNGWPVTLTVEFQ